MLLLFFKNLIFVFSLNSEMKKKKEHLIHLEVCAENSKFNIILGQTKSNYKNYKKEFLNSIKKLLGVNSI